ncbi:MAG: FliA/WhiG family RNA polymerase sigma factor [Nitrospirae bacterium CG_4_9_14_3_um_filter_53_35]|nr:MAG: RNA polymerase subunit sigma [Nitrospirae bacterium CG2_30_53_67]PIS36856.1 MAG: FliA/WhiG family RNA polymerase sigma factor [Nitrospirae bacterium CG08_land_8_20_14_0_20_52_24]PIV84139.1 MAG: FliA/WhiG family RNA polymerase sigma factor [Nitrospirae bacterium CG17_big_fil_post_rev_8_21_14_2_50_50_9]PIW86128.1 MAG: FliA/WhiG family RNA polymerase sigma factor [Nitrospirae bacterium CG_4_8_14_3_um_filter_50_41]PIX84789.1 MAG: FliA/WhiG family RNA polymerase sigma factor [Nitrospirae bac
MNKAQGRYKKNSAELDALRRNEIILEYAPQIKFIAHRLAMRLPSHVDLEDLINSGVIGLMDAVEKFDPSRNIQFKTYAEFRVRGAMLDDLRSRDWIPRSVRQKSAVLEKTYAEIEQRVGRPASDEEVAGALNITMDDFYDLLNRTRGLSLVSIEPEDEDSGISRKIRESLVADAEENPFNVLKKKELQMLMAKAIGELPDHEKKVVSLYYYDELTMKEIGKVLNITESRVSQIHTKAMLRMRGKLRRYLEG